MGRIKMKFYNFPHKLKKHFNIYVSKNNTTIPKIINSISTFFCIAFCRYLEL